MQRPFTTSANKNDAECREGGIICEINLHYWADPIAGQCELVRSEFYIDVSDRPLGCEGNEDCSHAFVENYCEVCGLQALTQETAATAREYRFDHECPNGGFGDCAVDPRVYADPISQCIQGMCQLVFGE